MLATPALPAPYKGCDTFVTFEDLIKFMYPGPEIFCQGLPRDPADSQFVIPFWMPYYDSSLGTRNHVIVTELVCERVGGGVLRSQTAFVLPEKAISAFPTLFP